MRQLALTNQESDFGRTGKNWIKPLQSWILDIQKAKKLSQSDNFEDIKVFVQKVGTNHQLLDKSASFSFSAPWDFLAQFLARRASGRGEHSVLSPAKKLKSFELWRRRESNPRLAMQPMGRLRAYPSTLLGINPNKVRQIDPLVSCRFTDPLVALSPLI